jgi:hypothetical protein
MTFQKFIGAAVLTAGLAALVIPASAQWSEGQRKEFINDCLGACRKNPRVPEAQRPQCDDYCNCVRSEGEKFLNEAQFDQLMKDFAARKQTPELKRFVELTPVCNQKAFGPR